MSTSDSLFKQNLVLLFVLISSNPFALNSSGSIFFLFTELSAILHAVESLLYCSTINEITIVSLSANQHPVI